jgi:hypothetical protein
VVPWAMLAALGSSVLLWKAGFVYRLAFAGQILFYAAAEAGFLLLRRDRRWKPTYTCFYFLFANTAVGMAWLRWLKGDKPDVWQKTERIPPGFGATSHADHGRRF